MTFLKSSVAGLALLNILYFLWVHGIAEPPPAPVARAPLPTLKLVSEAPPLPAAAPGASGLAGTNGGNPADAASAAGSPAKAARCISVGPFRDVAEAAHAAGTLRAAGYDPRQRVVDGDVWAGLWVYLPVPSSPAASEQMQAKLKAAGIDDALEMPGPVDGSVISLGLFSEPKRAQARVAQAEALGFSPGLADRKRTGNVYWVDIDLKPSDGEVSPADLAGDRGRISRLETKECPVAAP